MWMLTFALFVSLCSQSNSLSSNQVVTTSATTTATSPTSKVDTDDYKIKNALDGAKGSLQAVIDFLSKNGVAKARYVATRTIIHA
jgi:hypothetical protein